MRGNNNSSNTSGRKRSTSQTNASQTSAPGTPKPRSAKPSSKPTVRDTLKLPLSPMAVAFRHLKPDWRTYIMYVDMAATDGDKEMVKVRDAYLSLPLREQRTITPELLCELTNVKPDVLFGAVAAQAYKHSQQETSMILALNTPIVAAQMAKGARTKTGVKDREMFAKATGILPTPKGPSITVNANPQIANLLPPAGMPGQLGMSKQPIALPSPEAEILALEEGEGEEEL